LLKVIDSIAAYRFARSVDRFAVFIRLSQTRICDHQKTTCSV